MQQYPMTAKVQRIVTDTISLKVEAENESQAILKAIKVLEQFPSEVTGEGVNYMYIENREQDNVTVLDIEIED